MYALKFWSARVEYSESNFVPKSQIEGMQAISTEDLKAQLHWVSEIRMEYSSDFSQLLAFKNRTDPDVWKPLKSWFLPDFWSFVIWISDTIWNPYAP